MSTLESLRRALLANLPLASPDASDDVCSQTVYPPVSNIAGEYLSAEHPQDMDDETTYTAFHASVEDLEEGRGEADNDAQESSFGGAEVDVRVLSIHRAHKCD